MEAGMTPGVILALGLFLLTVIGGLVWVVGHLWILFLGFRESPGWGISLLIFSPLSDLLFTIDYWVAAKKPFIISLIGGAIMLIALGGKMMFSDYIQSGLPPVQEAAAVTAAPGGGLEEEQKGPGAAAASDRDRVAAMLQDAGIDPNNTRTFQGRTIQEMTAALGPPSATLKAGRETTYIFFNCFEVVSVDGGRTVSAVHYMGK